MAQKIYANIELLSTPSAPAHLVNKGYVDAAISKKVKDAVRVVTDSNIDATYDGTAKTLTQDTPAVLVIDGVTLAVGDRVLVTEQTDKTQNGIYTVTTLGVAESSVGAGDGVAAVLTRAADFDGTEDLSLNVMIPVQEGNVNADSTWVMTNDTIPTLDTDSITFGTYRAPDSAVAKTGTITGDGTTTTWTINHGLGTENITVSIVDASTKTPCYFDYEITSANAIEVKADVAPATGENFIVTVVG